MNTIFKTVYVNKDELQKLFNFLQQKLYAIETLFGRLMVAEIKIEKNNQQIKMTFKLKNVFRNEYHFLELIAGNKKLFIHKNNIEILEVSDRRLKWENFLNG